MLIWSLYDEHRTRRCKFFSVGMSTTILNLPAFLSKFVTSSSCTLRKKSWRTGQAARSLKRELRLANLTHSSFRILRLESPGISGGGLRRNSPLNLRITNDVQKKRLCGSCKSRFEVYMVRLSSCTPCQKVVQIHVSTWSVRQFLSQ